MNKEFAIRLLERKDIYLTPVGRKYLEGVVNGKKEVTSLVQTNSKI
ncbi:hypothetical protein [Bacillus sp. FJAT-45350]|nr:hypothetical protein [Bacillus sp. FJAT-45350]